MPVLCTFTPPAKAIPYLVPVAVCVNGLIRAGLALRAEPSPIPIPIGDPGPGKDLDMWSSTASSASLLRLKEALVGDEEEGEEELVVVEGTDIDPRLWEVWCLYIPPPLVPLR